MQNLTKKWYFWVGLVVLFIVAFGAFTQYKKKKLAEKEKAAKELAAKTPATGSVPPPATN